MSLSRLPQSKKRLPVSQKHHKGFSEKDDDEDDFAATPTFKKKSTPKSSFISNPVVPTVDLTIDSMETGPQKKKRKRFALSDDEEEENSPPSSSSKNKMGHRPDKR